MQRADRKVIFQNDAAIADFLRRLWNARHGRHADEEGAGPTSQNGRWHGKLLTIGNYAAVLDTGKHDASDLVSEPDGEKPQL